MGLLRGKRAWWWGGVLEVWNYMLEVWTDMDMPAGLQAAGLAHC